MSTKAYRNTKLILCSYFQQGYCKQGSRKCRFAHGEEEVLYTLRRICQGDYSDSLENSNELSRSLDEMNGGGEMEKETAFEGSRISMRGCYPEEGSQKDFVEHNVVYKINSNNITNNNKLFKDYVVEKGDDICTTRSTSTVSSRKIFGDFVEAPTGKTPKNNLRNVGLKNEEMSDYRGLLSDKCLVVNKYPSCQVVNSMNKHLLPPPNHQQTTRVNKNNNDCDNDWCLSKRNLSKLSQMLPCQKVQRQKKYFDYGNLTNSKKCCQQMNNQPFSSEHDAIRQHIQNIDDLLQDDCEITKETTRSTLFPGCFDNTIKVLNSEEGPISEENNSFHDFNEEYQIAYQNEDDNSGLSHEALFAKFMSLTNNNKSKVNELLNLLIEVSLCDEQVSTEAGSNSPESSYVEKQECTCSQKNVSQFNNIGEGVLSSAKVHNLMVDNEVARHQNNSTKKTDLYKFLQNCDLLKQNLYLFKQNILSPGVHESSKANSTTYSGSLVSV